MATITSHIKNDIADSSNTVTEGKLVYLSAKIQGETNAWKNTTQKAIWRMLGNSPDTGDWNASAAKRLAEAYAYESYCDSVYGRFTKNGVSTSTYNKGNVTITAEDVSVQNYNSSTHQLIGPFKISYPAPKQSTVNYKDISGTGTYGQISEMTFNGNKISLSSSSTSCTIYSDAAGKTRLSAYPQPNTNFYIRVPNADVKAGDNTLKVNVNNDLVTMKYAYILRDTRPNWYQPLILLRGDLATRTAEKTFSMAKRLTIKKVDEKDSKNLSGVSFELRFDNVKSVSINGYNGGNAFTPPNNTTKYTCITDANGEIKLTNIMPVNGAQAMKVYVKETKAPEGYMLWTGERTISLNTNGTITSSVSEAGTINTSGNYSLDSAGAMFTVKDKRVINLRRICVVR